MPGVLSQLCLENVVETGGHLAGECLWEAFLGHEPVFADKVDHHVPLTAVVDGVGQKTGDCTPVNRFTTASGGH